LPSSLVFLSPAFLFIVNSHLETKIEKKENRDPYLYQNHFFISINCRAILTFETLLRGIDNISCSFATFFYFFFIFLL